MSRPNRLAISTIRCLSLLFLLPLAFGTDTSEAQGTPDFQNKFEIEDAFPALSFEFPVDLANDGMGRLYVVERAGRIYSFPNDSTTQDTTVFLDIRDKVLDQDIESGLLSLSFHPNYEENGFFYIYYLTDDPMRSVLARFERSEADARTADEDSETVILEVDQPSPKHNGGDTSFDADGCLLLSLGDGSTGGDAFGNAQNRETLLGSIIRIDVDNPSDGKNYGIPPDNPYAGNMSGLREEIYAYGFRNPWRFSIDPESGHIWVGDVGEATWEEVDFVVKGGNYGWPIMEGPACYKPPENCVADDLYPPVHAYNHEVGLSVTGGFVYRGSRVPELQGRYLFADWSGRQLWALTYGGQNPYDLDVEIDVEQITDAKRFISSFGVDESGEVYMLFTFEGRIMRFVATTDLGRNSPEVPGFVFVPVSPNPFAGEASFRLSSERGGSVHVGVYDVLGREVGILFAGTLNATVERRITFDGSGLSSGVYFVRALSSEGVVTHTVILNR